MGECPEFARLDLDILGRKDLSYGAKCLYARLVLFAGESRAWEGTNACLGEALGCSDDNARLCLNELFDVGAVGFDKRSGSRILLVQPFDASAQFAKLMLNVLAFPVSKLSFASKCLHGLLLYFGRNGLCFPSQEKLAEGMACSDRHIRNARERLSRAGLVDWRSRGRTSLIYTVHEYPYPRIVPDIGNPEDCSRHEPRIVPAG